MFGGAPDDAHGYYLEDLSPGMSERFTKTVTETDIVLFAGISGDMNPVHIDEEFAAKSMFKGRIAHGLLTAAFISTVLGTRLPGPGCVYIKQNLAFRGPVRAGDTVTAQVTVAQIDPERSNVTLDCVCSVRGRAVLTGEAVMRVDRRPEPKAEAEVEAAQSAAGG